MKRILYFLVFLGSISIISCGREDSYTSKPIHIEPIKIQYFSKSSVLGRVLDQDFNPVSDCRIKYKDFKDNSKDTKTDENGIFKIKNKYLNENGQILTFEKEDYFTQYAYIKTKKNQLNFASIVQQLKNEERKIYTKANNKEFFYNNTIECIIPANSITDDDGKNHTGAFNLYCKSPFLKSNTICSPDFGIPFSNTGINLDNNNTVVLPLFSTLIQIEDTDNKQLYFGDSMTVIVKKENVPCLYSNRFVLWLFDPDSGKWIAQNEISSSGNTLKFKVLKTGYYIVTNKTDIILNIEGQLVYEDLSPAGNVYMEVIEPQTGLLLGQYFSDNFGTFRIFKEENSDILLRIPNCSNTDFEYKITGNDNNIGDIILPEDFNYKYELDIASPVANGFLVVREYNGYDFNTKLSVPVSDSAKTQLDFYGCDNEYLTLYDIQDLPNVYNSTPLYLYRGIQINSDELNPTISSDEYLYLKINEKEIFNVNNYMFLDKGISTLESVSSSELTAIRFNKTESYCHFSYIKFTNENDFDILETDKSNPLNFEIIEDNGHETIGHFFGVIDYNGESKTIDGYFKTTN